MRFHRVDLHNLNSLYGRHQVDFDARVGDSGLFLIHGPMGAGKSTLLDAICLALYGRTPRLAGAGRESPTGDGEGASDSNAVRMMSVGTVECSARLHMSIADEQGGRTHYRVGWYVERKGKQPDGAFDKPLRTLEQRVDGQWTMLVSTSRPLADWARYSDRFLRGLTFDDFQRSVMLAQFKFREFLEADEASRAAILERLTDTTRFRQIGKAVYQAHTAAKKRVEAAETVLGSSTVLTDEARASHAADLELAVREAAGAARDVESRSAAAAWWAGLASGRARLAEAGAAADGAQSARAAESERLSALAEDARVTTARLALEGWTNAEVACVRAEELCRQAAEAESVRRTATADLEAASAVAEDRRLAARAQRASRLPAVEQAEEAWRVAATAERASIQAAEAAARARSDASRAASVLEDASRTCGRIEDELATQERLLQEIPAHARVVAEAPRVAQLCAEHVERSGRATVAEARRAEAESDAASHAASRAALVGSVGAAAARVSEAEAQVEAVRGELSVLTGGREPAGAATVLDERRDAANARLVALTRLRTRWNDRAAAEAAHARAVQEVADRTSEIQTRGATERELAAACARAEVAVQDLRDVVAALVVLAGVAGHRDALADGHPCPLCGSLEHPYRLDPSQAPEGADDRLADARKRLAAAESVLAEARAADAAARTVSAGVMAALRAASAEQDRRAEELRVLAEEVGTLAEGVGLPADADAAAQEAASVGAQADVASAVGAAEALRTQLASLAVVERALLEARDGERGAAARVTLHDELAQEKARRVAEAVSDAEAAAAEARIARASLARALEALEVADADLVVGAARVARRAEDIRRIETTIADIAARRQPAAEARAHAAAGAELAATAERLARESDARLSADAAARLAEARAHLDGQQPAVVRRDLDTSVEAAEHAHAERARELDGARSALAAATALLEERDTVRRETAARRDEAATLLRTRLSEHGLADVDELRARILTDAARTALEALRTRLDAAVAAAGARRDEASAALDAHVAVCPADESPDADPEVRRAEVADVLQRAQEAVVEANRRVGTLRAVLAKDDEDRATHAVRAAEATAAREDFQHWHLLHEVIGESEGQKFVLAVQAINLGRVLVHANESLARFIPRYRLQQVVHAVEGPKLDFRVVDLERDGAARTTRSLSGGESFVVSLGLALGLAATRASRLRIETLLIDEGFGSLDHRRVVEATTALQALQSSIGVQIGVISHVEYLRDAIPAQIVVVPDGAGRSSIAPQ